MRTSAGISFRTAARIWSVALCFIALAACAHGGIPRTSYAVASWYGPQFHGRLTASGERFDMNSLTCAHKRLPFGTKLKLTNVENGNTVSVVVNDRGPFVRGRDLDVSKEAAKRLGIIGSGTGRLKVQVVGRDMRYRKYVDGKRILKSGGGASSQGGGPYTVQVGSFSDRSNAEYVKQGLELNHKKVYMVEKWINGKRYYRVRVGRFGTENQAEEYSETLADEGYDTFITAYGNEG